MKTTNKIKLAHFTTWTMLITIALILLFFIGFVVVNTFDLAVFTSRTSDFIFSFIGFSAVIVVCSAILNISLNIGLIADSHTKDLNNSGHTFLSRKFKIATGGLLVLLVSFLFLGDFLSRRQEQNQLVNEANDILNRYKLSIDKLSESLADPSKTGNIPEILRFLSNQKSEFPSVELITSDRYNGQLTFIEITEYDDKESLAKPHYGNSFYKCSNDDCSYLNNYFTGKTQESHFWNRNDNYKLYIPVKGKGKSFILLFSKYKRAGKVGSY